MPNLPAGHYRNAPCRRVNEALSRDKINTAEAWLAANAGFCLLPIFAVNLDHLPQAKIILLKRTPRASSAKNRPKDVVKASGRCKSSRAGLI